MSRQRFKNRRKRIQKCWWYKNGWSINPSNIIRSKARIRIASGWHSCGNLAFSKIELDEVDKFWLSINFPNCQPVYQFIEGYKSMPSYQRGEWNGKAYVVNLADRNEMMKFKAALGRRKSLERICKS